jgi:hypothetical protein
MIYIAYNTGMESASTSINGGQSCATGAKVTLQLGIPSGGQIQVVGYGVSFDEDATTNASVNGCTVALRSTATATTLGTAHSTTTVKPWLDPNAAASRLTMSTTATAYGAATPASSTTLRLADRRYIPQTGSVDIMFPSDRWPTFGATGAAEYVQLIVNTTATVNVLAYLMWHEII